MLEGALVSPHALGRLANTGYMTVDMDACNKNIQYELLHEQEADYMIATTVTYLLLARIRRNIVKTPEPSLAYFCNIHIYRANKVYYLFKPRIL